MRTFNIQHSGAQLGFRQVWQRCRVWMRMRRLDERHSLTPALSRWERENHPPSRSRTCDWIGRTTFRRSQCVHDQSPLLRKWSAEHRLGSLEIRDWPRRCSALLPMLPGELDSWRFPAGEGQGEDSPKDSRIEPLNQRKTFNIQHSTLNSQGRKTVGIASSSSSFSSSSSVLKRISRTRTRTTTTADWKHV